MRDALTLKTYFIYFILFFYFIPKEQVKGFYVYFNREAVEEWLWSSKFANLSFPELVIEFMKAVVATELPESRKFFFFILITSESPVNYDSGICSVVCDSALLEILGYSFGGWVSITNILLVLLFTGEYT